jgi:hypothetical protein
VSLTWVHTCVRWPPRHGAQGDVPVGDHADQPVIVADRQHTRIDLKHELGCLLDGVVEQGDRFPKNDRLTDELPRLGATVRFRTLRRS